MDEEEGKMGAVRVYHPTYLLKPRPGTKFLRRDVENTITTVLRSCTQGVDYRPDDMAVLCKEWAAEIQDAIKQLGYERYKLVTQVVIAEANGQGLRLASRCLWDAEEDNFAQAWC